MAAHAKTHKKEFEELKLRKPRKKNFNHVDHELIQTLKKIKGNDSDLDEF